jgi:hypothetical protein
MAQSLFRARPRADVWRKVFDLSGHEMTAPIAESIRALEGTLTAEEEAALEATPTSAISWPAGNRKPAKNLQHKNLAADERR